MFIVFNELSVKYYHEKYSSYQEAKKAIETWIKFLKKVKQIENFEGFITTDDFYSFRMGEYGIREWLNDSSVQKEQKIFLRTLIQSRCNFVQLEEYPLSEFCVYLENKKPTSLGCLIASEINENVLSLPTHIYWEKEYIQGEYSIIDLDTSDVESKQVSIGNISLDNHIDCLEQQDRDQVFEMLSSGQDLWEAREKLFPDLVFCNSVKKQLYKDPQKINIVNIATKLLKMQQYFENFNGIYNPKELGMNARTESDSVQNNPDLKALRLFEKPDGTNAYFYEHIGFTGTYCGRIHFCVDEISGKCYIGYIGKHLKTKDYKF